ncbi:MAG: fatty acid desaturase [Ginsengibacter sp.]
MYTTRVKKISIKEHLIFWTTKILYGLFYIVIPVVILGWGTWAIGFTLLHIFMGLTLAIVFQLAHVVEDTEFEVLGFEDKVIEAEWAVYQIKSTFNFAPRNKIITWFVGGLNFQVEHHLFPRISHVHYPVLVKSFQKNVRSLVYHIILFRQ